MSTVLLLSTYELGGQPLGIASVAGTLRAGGHEVLTCDLSVEEWPTEAVRRADCLCCSVPMHTALRLGAEVARRARHEHPDLPVFFYGLYAEVARAAGILEERDEAIEDDEAAALLGLCDRLDGSEATRPIRTLPADRRGLPDLDRYARFARGDEERLVATVAASSGCNHRCRHCPVPTVHHGRSRPSDLDDLLQEVDELVSLGARHVHFADPDFLNRPAHARRVMQALSGAHSGLTYDATIKVSHLLRFGDLLAEFADAGLVFVVSAFESTSDTVLGHLDKGHRSEDLGRAVRLLRAVGVEPRPSFLPFTPWTTRNDLVDLFDFIAAYDLIDNVDAVQYGIRLLLPPRSLLLDTPDPVLAAALDRAEPAALGVTWHSRDRLLDELADTVMARAQQSEALGESPRDSYLALRSLVLQSLGLANHRLPDLIGPPGPPLERRGRLTESWFCCAEPTPAQLGPAQLGATEAQPVFLGTSIGLRQSSR